jgi:hypothetical protein
MEKALPERRSLSAHRAAEPHACRFHVFVACDKSLRHETTTIVFIAADFASRSFLLLIRNPYRRTTNHATGPETKIDWLNTLRAR